MRTLRFWPILVLLLGGLLSGCHKEEISTYDVPRPEPAVRLLGVIVPHGDSTWFFKLAGPIAAIDEQKEAFDRFVHSLHPVDKDTSLAWTLPAGWTEGKGPAPRYATIKLASPVTPLELTVSRLGKEGQAGSIRANVNRWRRNDLGLTAALPEEDLPRVCREDKAGSLSMTVVDMSGPGASPRSKPAMPKPEVEMPAPPEPAGQPSYTTPPGWQETSSSGAFRAAAAFQVKDGNKTARVTVMQAGGSVAANINRWRGQIGLDPVAEDQVEKDLKKIKVDGNPAKYADLAGPQERILGVIADHNGETWFFKMQGPGDLVQKQRDNFDKFLASFKFEGGR